MSGKPLPKLTPRKAPPTLGGEGGNGAAREALLSTSPNTSRSPNLPQPQEPSITSSSSIARPTPGSAYPASTSPRQQENEEPFAPPSVPVKPYPPRLTLRPRGPSSSKSDGQGLGLTESSHPLSPFTFSFDAADATSTSLSSATSSSPARSKAGSTKKKSIPAPSSMPTNDFTLSDPQFFPRKYHKNQKSAASSRPESQYSTYTASSAKDAMIRTASREKLQKGSAKFRERPGHDASPGEGYGDQDGWEEGEMSSHKGGSSSGSEYDPDERDAYGERGSEASPSGHRSARHGKAGQLSLALGSGSSTAGGLTQSLSPTSPIRSKGDSATGSPSRRLLPIRDPSSSGMARSVTAPNGSRQKNRLSGSSKANSVLSIRMPAQRPPLARTASGAQSLTGRRSLSTSNSVFTIEDLPLPETYLPGQWAESPSAHRGNEALRNGDAGQDQEEDANLVKLAAFSFPHAALDASTMDDSLQSYQSSAGLASTSTTSGVTGQSSRRLRWKEAIAYAQQKEREAAETGSASHSKVISVTEVADDGSDLPTTSHPNREGSQSRASIASRRRSMTGGHSNQASIDRILTNLQASTPAVAPVPFSKDSFLSNLLSSQATAEVSATFPSQSVFESVEDFESAKKELIRLQNRLVDKKNKLRTMKRLRGARGKLVKAASSERGGGALSTSGSQESGLVIPGRARSNTINPATGGASSSLSAASLAGGLFPLVPPTPRFSHAHNLSHSSNSSATSAQPYSLSAVGTSNEALDAATAQVDQIMEEVLSLQERVGALKSRIREHIAIVLLKRCEELEKGGRTREVVFVRGGQGAEELAQEDNEREDFEEEREDDDGESPLPAHAQSTRERGSQPRQADGRILDAPIDTVELSSLRSQAHELSQVKDREADALQEIQHLRSQLDLFESQSEELSSVRAREARSLQEIERLRSEIDLIKSTSPMAAPTSEYEDSPSAVQERNAGDSHEGQTERELEELRAQLDLTKLEYEERCAGQEADLKRLRDELVSAQGAAAAAEEKLEEAQRKRDELDEQHQTLRLQHAELGARHEDLESSHQDLEGRHQDLEGQREALISSRDVTQTEIAARSAADQARDADYQQREQDLISRHAAALSEVRQALEQHQAEAQAVRGELSATRSRAEVSDSELASAHAKVAQLEEAVRAQELSAEQEKQELRAELNSAHSDAQALRGDIATLRSELESSNTLQASLSAQVSALQGEVDGHNARSASQAQAVRDAVAQHDSLELAVTAERRIMAERDALFHAFEARLERAEAVLREQDKRCAALLGKAEGREELDDFLAKIRGGGIKKADKTAGQDIDALLESLGVHVEDLADELDRRGRGRSGSVFSLSNTEDLMGRPQSVGQRDAGANAEEGEQAAVAIAELEDRLEESQYEVIQLRGELQSSRIQLEAMSTAIAVPQEDHAAEREKDARLAELQRDLVDLQDELARVKSETAAAATGYSKRDKSPVEAESGEDEHSSLVKVAGSDHEGDIVKAMPKYRSQDSTPAAELIRDLFVALQDVLPASLDANVARGDDMKALQTALEAPATVQAKIVISPNRTLNRGKAAFEKTSSPASPIRRPGFGASKGSSVRDLVRNFSGGAAAAPTPPAPAGMTPSTSAKSFNSVTTTSFSSTSGPAADDANLSVIVDRARLTLMAAKVATQKAIETEVTRGELRAQLDEARGKSEQYRQAIERLKSRSIQDQREREAAAPTTSLDDQSSPRVSSISRRGFAADPLPHLRTSGLKLGPLPSRSVDSVLDPFNDSSTSSFPSATSGNGSGSGASTPFGAALSTAPSSATRRTSSTVARSRLKPLNSAAFLSNSNSGAGGVAGYTAAGWSQPGSGATSPTLNFKPLPSTPGEVPVPLTPTFATGLGLGHPSSAPGDATLMRRSVSARPALSGPGSGYNSRSLDKPFGSSNDGAASSGTTPTSTSAVPQRSITLGLSTSQLVSRIRTLETTLAAHSSPLHPHSSQWSMEQVSRLQKNLEAKEEEVRHLKDEVGRVREEEGVQKARLMEQLNDLQEEMARQSKSKGNSAAAAAAAVAAPAPAPAPSASESAALTSGTASSGGGTTLLKAPSPLMLASQTVRSTSPFAAWMSGGSGGGSGSGAGGPSAS